MSQVFSLSLGKGKTGITLNAQLASVTGSDIDSPITSGFVEIGAGNYIWNYNLDDSFQGIVKFIDSSNDEVLAVTSVNPNKLSSDGLDNILIEDNINMRQSLSIVSAALGGVIDVSTGEVTIKAMADENITRIQAKVNSSGERTEVTLNLPD